MPTPPTASSSPTPATNDAETPLTASRIDDEPLRLVTSFNDLFVVIAAALLNFGLLWLFKSLPYYLTLLISAGVTWGLSEIFVRRRRMAFPALCFSVCFVAMTATAALSLVSVIAGYLPSSEDHGVLLLQRAHVWSFGVALATAIGVVAGAALYWWRFRAPVTMALGVGGLALTVWFYAIANWGPAASTPLLIATVIAGLIVFGWAMRWDAHDPKRMTLRSDVAFWLHLVAACMITHPIFRSLMPEHPVAAIGVYIVLLVVSLVIDRRALMISSLIYVLYAIGKVFATSTGFDSQAPVALVVGATLLLLSVFWQDSRKLLLRALPTAWRERLPR